MRFDPTVPLAGLVLATTLVAQDSPVLAHLDRHDVPAHVRGLVLMRELSCAACHLELKDRAPARQAPDLSDVTKRVSTEWIQRFVKDPQKVKPGAVMPRVQLGDSEVTDDSIEALTAYLMDRSKGVLTPAPHDAVAAGRGRELFHTIGCVACHAPRDDSGVEQPTPHSVALGHLSDKYSADTLREFLLAPHASRPAARMPEFGLSPQEAYDLSHFLTQGDAPKSPRKPGILESDFVEAGAMLYATSCASCHESGSDELRSRPIANLDSASGCLSPTPGSNAPVFSLTDRQRTEIRAALAHAEELDAPTQVHVELLSRNCVACHQRGDLGGVPDDRSEYFTTTDPALGISSRIPPPLEEAGAKLQADWLRNAIAHGQEERDYVVTRMPGFGEAFGEHMAALFQKADPIPDAEILAIPTNRKERNEVRDLGKQLVGDQGMSCIACHTFAGQAASELRAIDLVASTGQRLRPEWFKRYMLDPLSYQPGTIMPPFFANGSTTRPDIADGDIEKQLQGLWAYLSAGRNIGKPRGLRLPPIELKVDGEAVMLRRSMQRTGKRGIGVGYPGGVSVTFDAESLAMNQIWWGRFLDVGPVFYGQGSGQARVPEREFTDLGKGPAFAVLDLAQGKPAAWPDGTRRDLGQRLLGYTLDDKRRPTFRYTFGDATIVDYGRESDGGFRRTLGFDGDTPENLWFRAAHSTPIESLGDNRFRIGRFLELAVTGGRCVVRTATFEQTDEKTGETKQLQRPELLVEIGAANELTLEYRKTGGNR